eukprot:s3532_g4.t1
MTMGMIKPPDSRPYPLHRPWAEVWGLYDLQAMRVHVAEKVEDASWHRSQDAAQGGPTEEAPAKERRAPVPRFRSSWTGGTVLWNSEKTSAPAAGQAVWQWEHRTGFKNYDARATARIEDAFQRGLSRVRLKAGKMDDTPMELQGTQV